MPDSLLSAYVTLDPQLLLVQLYCYIITIQETPLYKTAWCRSNYRYFLFDPSDEGLCLPYFVP